MKKDVLKLIPSLFSNKHPRRTVAAAHTDVDVRPGMSASKRKYHLLALLTVIIWGATFVSTKVLLNHGLGPQEIMIYRFLLAYLGIWFIGPARLFAKSPKDELLCVVLGITGGSLYFLLENTALQITLASNVSLIICTSPIFTALLVSVFFRKEKLSPRLLSGSAIALVGVAFVVYNGSFLLRINPLGDFLTILAAISWAFYGIILKELGKRYSSLFITRKVFIYGILTILPVTLSQPDALHPARLAIPAVAGNIAFLGIAASLLAYLAWNVTVKELGVIKTTNYIYFIPLVTLLASAVIIREKITLVALAGAALIVLGVYMAESGRRG